MGESAYTKVSKRGRERDRDRERSQIISEWA